MSKPTAVVTVEECLNETDAAILLLIDGEEYWTPRSVIADQYERDTSYKGWVDFELEIHKWFADKEDIPYED